MPTGSFDTSRWTRAPAVGEDAGADEDEDVGEDEMVRTGALSAFCEIPQVIIIINITFIIIIITITS